MRCAVLSLALASLVAGIATLQQPAGATPVAARIVDRTFSCSIPIQGGVREIAAFARSGVRDLDNSKRWRYLAHTYLHTGSNFDAAFIGVGAGAPPPLDSSAGLWIETRRCRAVARRVPLTAAGLDGGSAPELGDVYACRTPPTILIRIRAVFRAPTSLHRLRFRQLGTGAPVREAYLAARTESGGPVMFAAVFESGRARLFTARNCVAG